MPREGHFINRSASLRAAVLGANDGILSTASLIVGVAAASTTRGDILLTGLAGTSAGALSMAAGEYVSVSAQADIEAADLIRERRALSEDPEAELTELGLALEARGVAPELSGEVARQMTCHDALGAHAREELGLTEFTSARPMQAAFNSGASFAIGAAVPLLGAVAAPRDAVIPVVGAATLLALAGLGASGAMIGGAPARPAAFRVVIWGALAMVVTAILGRLVDGSLG